MSALLEHYSSSTQTDVSEVLQSIANGACGSPHSATHWLIPSFLSIPLRCGRANPRAAHPNSAGRREQMQVEWKRWEDLA